MNSIGSMTRRFALPEWRWYLGGIIALALTNVLTLEIPQFAKFIVNNIDSKPRDELAHTALLIVGLGALLIIIRSLSRVLLFWPGRKIETTLKSHLFGRLMTLPSAFYLRHGMGDLISRLANDVGHLRVFYAFAVLQTLNLVFLLVFTLNQMMSVHVGLTLAALTPLLLMLGIITLTMPKLHRYSKLNQEALGRLTNRVTESFVNVHVLQANAATEAFLQRTERENFAVYDSNMKLLVVRQIMFPMMAFLANISQVAVLFYGGFLVVNSAITVGDIMAFNVYIGYLSFPLSAVGIVLSIYLRAKTAIERLADIEATAPESTGVAQGATGASAPQPLLAIRRLNFQYPTSVASSPAPGQEHPQQPFRLENIDLDLARGKRLGLCGPIGCGKTTLLQLIARLYDPPARTVYFNGQDICTLSPQELRTQIGFAQQTVHLFSDTIRNNLLFGLVELPSEADILRAADLACIRSEIEAFPQGWDTEIGERGVRLSGGQKQRLALARIFLRRPAIVLLDDVLSAVDQTTEQRLINAIDAHFPAAIIASHRISALRRCDEVVLLKQGQIADRGSFSEMVKRHPDLLREDTDASHS